MNVGSQTHLEMPVIDFSVQETLADIPPMTYACMAIDTFPSSFSCLLQAIVKEVSFSAAFPTLTLKTTWG